MKLYKPSPLNHEADFDEYLQQRDHNYRQLSKIDWAAKQTGGLLGRVIYHPFADGQAIYQIIKVNAKTVRIRVCTGLGDDWVLPAWGAEATISKQKAQDFVRRQDGMDELFGGHPSDPNRKARGVRANSCPCPECQGSKS